MPIEVKVPVLPESVTEATLLSWNKQPGEAVQRDEILVEVETDKVVLEVVAEADGVLSEIRADAGTTVGSGEVIAVLDTEGAKAAGTATRPDPAKDADATASKPPAAPEGKPAPATPAPALSPAVRKLVAEHDLDPAKIPGSGKDGRLTKEDVLRHLAQQPQTTSGTQPPEETARATTPLAERTEERVPMTRIRQRIAERLLSAQQTAAILTTFNEVDMKPIMDLRARYRDAFEKEHGVRLGFMSFFVKAAVEALKRFPVVNAAIDGDDIVYHGYYDIGVAVSSARGLVVPILRDADQLSFAAVEQRIGEFGQRAQENKITLEELQGGTFSISNGGIFGSMLSTPILNPPQSAILGMHNIVERPVAVNGEVVVRPVMYLALSYDHRIIDGREAVTFLVTIKQLLEDPARLLLQV